MILWSSDAIATDDEFDSNPRRRSHCTLIDQVCKPRDVMDVSNGISKAGFSHMEFH